MANLLTKLIRRDSTSIEWLFLAYAAGQAYVKFKDGSTYRYEDVSREAMFIVAAHEEVRLGQWVNENLVHLQRSVAPENITDQLAEASNED